MTIEQLLDALAEAFVKEARLQTGQSDQYTVNQFVDNANIEDEVKDRVRTLLGDD